MPKLKNFTSANRKKESRTMTDASPTPDPYASMRNIRAQNESKKIEQAKTQREVPSKDLSTVQPASGPMNTDGPNGTSEGLPKTVEPFDKVSDASKDCGGAMSLDAIKANAKRIGRY
jgi:hypothetical protein